MNQNETLEQWIAEKRKLSPSPAFSQSVMASVGRAAEARLPVTRAYSQSNLADFPHVQHWVTSAAVLVCVMRTACFVQMVVEPTRECSLVAQKTISEMPNVK